LIGGGIIKNAAWDIGCGLETNTGRDERLEESNSLLRSAYQVALRGGENTNWDTFGRRLRLELDRQFKENRENLESDPDLMLKDLGAGWAERSEKRGEL